MKPKAFAALAAQWLDHNRTRLAEGTVERYSYTVAALSPYFDTLNGGLAEAVDRWQRIRRTDVSAGTFNLELGTLQAILDFGVIRGKPKTNPANDVKPQRQLKPQPATPSREQFTALVAKLRELGHAEDANTVELLAYSGLRKAEAQALTWGNADLAAGTLIAGMDGNRVIAKNGEARAVPLFEPLRQLLDRLKTERGPDATKSGDRIAWSAADPRYSLHRACVALGLPHYRAWHTFRSYFITEALLQGCAVPVVAKWVGHSDGGALIFNTYNRVHDSFAAEQAKMVK